MADNNSNYGNNHDNNPIVDRESQEAKSFAQDFKERMRRVRITRWIRFGIVSVLFFLWVIWMGNPWLGLIWLLLIDIYLTAYIPWGWWKKMKPGPMRTFMSWIDAIIYALVLVYMIFAFIGQNYRIPSSSLEKSLLVGDFLWVNKALYGPRVPQTPIHFPLAQHTLPILETKSYIDNPQLEYHRLPGLRSIERGDIVVFNFPQGDTVPARISNPDYYQICYDLRQKGISNPKGYIESNPELFGELLVRPVDRRENYVKRAIGLPGERLMISGDTIYIDGTPIKDPTNVQFNYIIPVSSPVSDEKWASIGVRRDDYGSGPVTIDNLGFRFYDVPLTADMKREVESWPEVSGPLQRESESGFYELGGVFPLGASYGWTRPDMGEFWIPKRGSTLHLNPCNYPIYERIIRTYEGNDLEMRDGKIYLNGEPTEYYTFRMDYYWMMGDNRDRSLDSRYWGFVPEDHIVGTPMIILGSFDEDRSLFDGKIRWNRILKDANPDRGEAVEKGWKRD